MKLTSTLLWKSFVNPRCSSEWKTIRIRRRERGKLNTINDGNIILLITSSSDAIFRHPIVQQQLTSNGYYANSYEYSFQGMSQACYSGPNPANCFQAFYPQAHITSRYSDNQIYDQPPPSTPNETDAHISWNGNQSQSPQRLYEGVSPKVVHPIPPATAPASRRRFRRSNYESEDLSVDESGEEDEADECSRGGTILRRKPAPPISVLMNQYSRESLQDVSAYSYQFILCIAEMHCFQSKISLRWRKLLFNTFL